MEEVPDHELVAAAQGGDDRAYGLLIRRYQGLAARVAATVAGTSIDVEAAVQEGFVKAHRALDRLRAGAPFRPWVLAIVANEARNLRRAEGRHAQATFRFAARSTGELVASPEAIALDGEQRAQLLRAVNRLPTIDRQVLACRFFLELDERETAEVLRVARGTVKSRQSRALRRLRRELGAEAGVG